MYNAKLTNHNQIRVQSCILRPITLPSQSGLYLIRYPSSYCPSLSFYSHVRQKVDIATFNIYFYVCMYLPKIIIHIHHL